MAKIGRNAPCPCGSGKKYKKCCLRKEEDEHLKKIEKGRRRRRARAAQADMAYNELFEDVAENAEWVEGLEAEDNQWPSEEESISEGRNGWEPREPSPKIEQSLPELSGENQAVVDKWWEKSGPIYLERDVDKLIPRIETFMEAHPALFVHLYLHEECLFELGAELARRGEHHRYVELLQRIRREHPEVFLLSHAYYDRDIITELILDEQQEDISQYLNFFKEYPDSNPDGLAEVIDILLATNCQEALFDLVRQTAIPVACSPHVIRGGFALGWFFFEQYIPYLEKGGRSERDCRDFVETLNGMDLPFDPEFDLEQIKTAFTAVFDGVAAWDITRCAKQRDLEEFYDQIGWNFMSWLKQKKGLTWATARFFADRLGAYFTDIPEGKRPKKAFGFEQERLDRHIATNYKRLFFIDGVRAISLLQAVYDFGEYLRENRVFSEEDVGQTRDACLTLFETCKKVVPETDAGPRIFAGFPEYRWTL